MVRPDRRTIATAGGHRPTWPGPRGEERRRMPARQRGASPSSAPPFHSAPWTSRRRARGRSSRPWCPAWPRRGPTWWCPSIARCAGSAW